MSMLRTPIPMSMLMSTTLPLSMLSSMMLVPTVPMMLLIWMSMACPHSNVSTWLTFLLLMKFSWLPVADAMILIFGLLLLPFSMFL